jgi:NAD(P)-dependent dehydrogenase (short-subunit alcohol dehydrogenase family)
MGVVIATGGSRGIGAEICRLAAQRGHRVCVNYLRGEKEADAIVAEIVKSGGHAISVKADVTVESDVSRLFEAARARLGPVTALVNNAGWGGQHGQIESWDIDATRKLIELNLLGPMICSREAVKRMARKYGGAGGSIVNISSAAARTGAPGVFIHHRERVRSEKRVGKARVPGLR